MEDNKSKNKRIAKNTAFLYVRMFFVLVISLYTSRVIINALGVEDFGIYNVVSGFVSLFTFLKATLSASMQRFYNYELGKGGERGVQRVYSTGFWIHVIICLILLVILESGGLYYINYVMVIPPERLFAANIVYQTAVLSTIIVIMEIPYLGAVLAYEKMGCYAKVSILDVVLKLVIAIVLPILNYDKLIYYAIFLFLITITNFLLYYIYSKINFKGIKLSVRDGSLSKEMFAFAGWNFVGTFAFMIKDQGINMLLNFFFGPVVNAARGISFQVKNAVGGFTQSITTAFRPQIVDAYVKEEKSRVISLFYLESKACFSLILLLIIPIVIEIDYILDYWIGDIVPQYASMFTCVILFDSLVCSINPSLNHVVHAVGYLKNYQKANSFVNIMIIPFSWLVLYCGGNPLSVFIVSLCFSILNQIVCIIELNRLYDINLNKYIKDVIVRCAFVALSSFAPNILLVLMLPDSFFRLMLVIILDLIITPMLVYGFVLNVNERAAVKVLIANKIRKC